MTQMRLLIMNKKGQVAIETVVRATFLIAGIVYLGFYLQRTMQGSLFGSSRSLGLQYDPRDTYQETQTLYVQDSYAGQDSGAPVGFSLIAADLIKVNPVATQTGPQKMYLESLPEGPIPREPAWVAIPYVESEWTVKRKATYNDNR